MGIRKDIRKYIKELEPYSLIKADTAIRRLNEILENNEKKEKKKTEKRLRNEYIAVKSSSALDDGDTFEAIKDGYGLPKTGYKYVKVRK